MCICVILITYLINIFPEDGSCGLYAVWQAQSDSLLIMIQSVTFDVMINDLKFVFCYCNITHTGYSLDIVDTHNDPLKNQMYHNHCNEYLAKKQRKLIFSNKVIEASY